MRIHCTLCNSHCITIQSCHHQNKHEVMRASLNGLVHTSSNARKLTALASNLLPTTMKFQRLLPLAVLACTANVLAAPSFFDNAQEVLSYPGSSASRYLSEAKQSILRGKKNLETWYHDGREYIKEHNLLCESLLVLFSTPTVLTVPRRACSPSLFHWLHPPSDRA